MINKDHMDALRVDFVRKQAQFANVIQELEAELKRMRDNDRIPEELITKKDEQIETLILFNNKIEDLIKTYQMAVINYHYELLWLEGILWKAMRSNHTAFEVFMADLKTTKLIVGEPKPG